ncbi:hypothetical protein PGS50_22160 [Yersinia intermedia]|uniref:hypothetical protein n=1 Tax=Yersinia intermedia TaxID=631 RepID=UPI0022FDB422|nr:hypothetical protein [Yersinia intermedia]MDA5495929.1 hypothetical protein [Yersinia intermedia]
MKLWIVSSAIFLSSIAHASFIIEPNENDHACSLAKRDSLTVDKKNPLTKSASQRNNERRCKYQLNDYRTYRDSEVGCAVNKNRIISKTRNQSNCL